MQCAALVVSALCCEVVVIPSFPSDGHLGGDVISFIQGGGRRCSVRDH